MPAVNHPIQRALKPFNAPYHHCCRAQCQKDKWRTRTRPPHADNMETIESQRTFWNAWNAENREASVGEISRRQAEIILEWLGQINRNDLAIIEVGCGTGWLCPLLTRFGQVTGTDLSDDVLRRAQVRWPQIEFIAGDFAALPLKAEAYDVVVSLEVLSHIADQQAFISQIARLLKPGGVLLIATQNRTVLAERCHIPPPRPGQLRNWVDREEFQTLLQSRFHVERLVSASPVAHKGLRRLLTGQRVNNALRGVIGNRWRDFLERRGWGWTLMATARKSR